MSCKALLVGRTGGDEETSDQPGDKKGKRQRKRNVQLEETVVGKRRPRLHAVNDAGCKRCWHDFIRTS